MFVEIGGDDLSESDSIKLYNYYIGIILELFKRIITVNKIDNIQYVCVGGERVLSYRIWNYELDENDRAFGFSLNLLPDGRLIYVSRSGVHRKEKSTKLSFVENHSEMFFVQNDYIYCTLADIYNAIYRRRNDFGISFDSEWPEKATDFYISHL